jgi:hypothetical protein
MLLLLTSAFGPQSGRVARGKSGPPVTSWRFPPNRHDQWNMFPDVQR